MRPFPSMTIQQILEPLAQQVSQLAIIHEETEAGKSIPDITMPVQAACAAVANLVQVGQDTANASSDEKFKQEMNVALEVVKNSSVNLNQAAHLLKDGSSSLEARNILIDGTKGILSGTSDLLFSYDESEVKKIVRVCNNVKDYMPNASVITHEADYQTYTKSVKSAVDNLLIRIRARADDLLIELNRQLLKRSCINIEDAVTSIESVLKAIIDDNQEAEPLQNSRDSFVGIVCEELEEIIRVLMLPFTETHDASQDHSLQNTSLCHDFDKLRDHLVNAQSDKEGYRDKLIENVVSKGVDISKKCDTTTQTDIANNCNSLQQHNRNLKDNTDTDPSAQATKKEMIDIMDNTEQVMQKQLAKQIAENFADPGSIIEELQNPAVLKDNEKIKLKCAEFVNLSDSLASTAEDVALFGSDKLNLEQTEEIRSASRKLRKVAPTVVNAAMASSSNIENQSIRQFSDGIATQWKDTASSLSKYVDGAMDSHTLIAASEEAVEKSANELSEAIESSNPQGILSKASDFAKHAGRVSTIAKREVENSEDPIFSLKITEDQKALENDTVDLITCANVLAADTNDQVAKDNLKVKKEMVRSGVHNVRKSLSDALDDEVEQATEKVHELEVADVVKDAKPVIPRIAEETVVEEVPVPQEPVQREEPDEQIPDYLTNPIAEAARSLRRETSRWSDSDNDIIATASKAAGLMGTMSKIVEDGSDITRKEIIQTAKDIAKISDLFVKYVEEIARKCSDKRMKENLKVLLQRLPTISTQLKVVATVKATAVASGDEKSSREANEVLVLNATNLMNTIKETVSAAKAASIKIRTDSGQKVEWRRNPAPKFY
ncbi:Vinculin [Trichoplax sp. H2]|nr:Vinculin [Trichoplax sp. H2]|eukprot:RDD39173.1 Vinculin [Trichoplax sp. H2]